MTWLESSTTCHFVLFASALISHFLFPSHVVVKIPNKISAGEIQWNKQQRSLDKHHCSLVRDLNSAWALFTYSDTNCQSAWYAQWTTAVEITETEAQHWWDWSPPSVAAGSGLNCWSHRGGFQIPMTRVSHRPLQWLSSGAVHQAIVFRSWESQNSAARHISFSSLKLQGILVLSLITDATNHAWLPPTNSCLSAGPLGMWLSSSTYQQVPESEKGRIGNRIPQNRDPDPLENWNITC